ncbi:MAG: hypothetical protein N2510_04300 [Ignavibacteria bacterium]|nr:hypothetical protein [Ignavibacteria bacterium]
MKKIFILLLSIYTIHLSAQTDPCSIEYKTGGGMPYTTLIGIHENLLLVSEQKNYKIINVDKIAKVRFDYGTYWKTGAAVGAAIGFVSGFWVYQIWGKEKIKFLPRDATLGTLLFTIPSAIIGGIIGRIFKNVDIYDMSKMNSFVKSKELKYILKDHAKYK